MKRGHKFSLVFIVAAFLSGCSTQTPLDERLRLLEYEKCLDFYTESAIKGNYLGSSGGSSREAQKNDQIAYRYWVLEVCESRRP